MPPKNRKGLNKKQRVRQQKRVRQRRRAARPTKLEQQAKRDVGLAYSGQFKSLKREKKRAKGELAETDTRLQDIYGDLAQSLAPLNANYEQGAAQITGDYNRDIGGISNTFTQAPVMGTEGASQAAANLFGTIGAGGNTLLANDRMRNLGYQTSTQRQGALEQKDARFDALQAYKDIIDDIRERRLDIKGDQPAVLKQRLDELKEQRFGRNLQKRELDIAEEQFGKEFGLRKKESKAIRRSAAQKNRRKNREQRTAEHYLRDEDVDKAARRTLRQTKASLAEINSQIAHLNAAIGPVTGGADSPVNSGLYRKRKRFTRKKKRIKRRRAGAKSELRD